MSALDTWSDRLLSKIKDSLKDEFCTVESTEEYEGRSVHVTVTMYRRSADLIATAQLIRSLYKSDITTKEQDASFMAIVRDDEGEVHYTSDDDTIRG